jgi:hypothetical protein
LRRHDKFFPQCTRTSVRAFLAQRLCDRDGFDGLTLPARPNFVEGMQNGCPPNNAKRVSPQRFLEQNQTAFWQLEETAKARRSAFPSRNEVLQGHTPRYSIAAASLVFRLDRLLAFGTTLAERVPLRVPGGHDNAQRSTSASSTNGRRRCSCSLQR